MRDGEQIAMWAPERGGFSLAKPSIPILESLNSLKRVNLKEEYQVERRCQPRNSRIL